MQWNFILSSLCVWEALLEAFDTNTVTIRKFECWLGFQKYIYYEKEKCAVVSENMNHIRIFHGTHKCVLLCSHKTTASKNGGANGWYNFEPKPFCMVNVALRCTEKKTHQMPFPEFLHGLYYLFLVFYPLWLASLQLKHWEYSSSGIRAGRNSVLVGE